MKKSMSLIEVLVAAFIISLIFVGTFGVVSAARQAGSLSSEKMQALYFGQATMESIRNIRDTNLENGAPNFDQNIGTGYRTIICSDPAPAPNWPHCAQGFKLDNGAVNMDIGSGFNRTINITKNSDILDVKVTINWKNGASSVNLEEQLTNWKK